MYKKILTLSFLALFLSLFAFSANAIASSLVVKLEQPKTPTNQNSFKLNFVALDINNNAVTVRCFKKGPSDGGFTQFDGDKVLKAGGNSGYCSVTNSILSANGSYQFKVTAVSDVTVDSSTVNVDFNTSTPSTPNSYSKDRTSSCQYTIKFKTDNDGGKTTKVVLYRSENLSFGADSGTQVESRNVGSDTNVEIINSVPDCSKNYYYAVRSYDSTGNGSGIIGDSFTTTVSGSTTTVSGSTANATPTTAVAPAIIAATSGVSPESPSVTPTPSTTTEETATPAPTEVTDTPAVLGANVDEKPFWENNVFKAGILALVVGTAIIYLRKKK